MESGKWKGKSVRWLHRVYVLYVDFTNKNHTLLIVRTNCMHETTSCTVTKRSCEKIGL